MSISSLAQRTSNLAVSNACVEYRTTAAGRCMLIEFSYIQQGAATAASIGLGRPAATGVTPVNTLFQRDNPAEPSSNTNGALSWATSPTSPTQFHRRWSSPATIGAGVVWIFPRGLTVPLSSSVVCFNITATVAADTNAIIDE